MPEKIEALREELARWRGTPFVSRVAVCQGGGDCVRTAHAVLTACGWECAVDWPDYVTHGEDARKLTGALDVCPALARRPDNEPMQPGDMVAARSKRTGSPHVAIYAGADRLWHMSPQCGWRESHVQVAAGAWEMLAVYEPVERQKEEGGR